MSTDKNTPALPGQTDLAITRTSPYGTLAEPTYSGVTRIWPVSMSPL